MAKNYPTTINGFNCYTDGDLLVGVADEVTLPDFSSTTTTITGAGVAGSIEVPIIGFFDAQDFVIPFRTLVGDTFKVMKPNNIVNVTLRGSIQALDKKTGAIGMQGMRVSVRGYVKAFSPGSVKVADQMNSSVTLSLVYILIEVNNDIKIELDKLNSKFVVDGIDVMEEMRGLC